MPDNKRYALREQVLDRMLQTPNGATVVEMMDACNNAFYNAGYSPISAQNTILNDLLNIENKYKVPIERLRNSGDHRIVRYRYANPNFSIFKVAISESDALCLSNALSVLERFQGLPENGWIDELNIRLRTFLKNENHERKIVGFDTNPLYKGNMYLTPLFEAISKQQTLRIQWTLINGMILEAEFWPYYIKQSGHAWYLVAANTKNSQLDGIPLGSITKIVKSNKAYQPCATNLDEYFSERIGASSSFEYREPVTITFRANEIAHKMLSILPIHRTQRTIYETGNGDVIMQINVVYTIEMLNEFCKYEGNITILSPADIRHTVARCHASGLINYGYKVNMDDLDEIITDQEETTEITTIDNMKVLTLIIKQVYFDQIIAGTKTQEFREVKPTTVKRLIELDDEGFEKEDEYHNAIPVKYDAIQFYVGYNKDRDSALVEVKDAYTEMFVDEDGKIITYEYDGQDWVAEQVVYNLGKVLEKNIHPKD